MHRVFISNHHEKDQWYKEKLIEINKQYSIFIDMSVDTGDIPDNWSDEEIRQEIRDEYLRDSTVTILLLGKETKFRKYIDWELYSSMYNGKLNKQSGILVVNLPTIKNNSSVRVAHGEKDLYPEITSWTSIDTRRELEGRHPCMPERIIDNLLNPDAKISVTCWDTVTDLNKLKALIDITFKDRLNCKYDLKKPMKRQNFNPQPLDLY